MRIKTFIVAILICLLSACSSMGSSFKNSDDKKIKTAKINTQLGMAYLQRHDVQLAKQKLLLALEQAPSLPEAWYTMAYYLEATGDSAKANQYYQKALALAPKNGEVQNNYGTYLCRSGSYQNAIQHFLSAVEDPQYLNTASAYENAGLCALKIPNQQLAMRYFNHALMQDPNLPTSLIELAAFHFQQKNYAAAKEKLQLYLAIAPPTPQSTFLTKELRIVQ
jgi:type IV pilus assembly protein PilF